MRSPSACAVCAIAVVACGLIASGQALPASDWAALDAEAAGWYVKGDLAQAIRAADAAVRAATTPAQSGHSLDRLGFFNHMSGNLADGEKFLRQSLSIRDAVFGASSLDYAETANDLALLLRDRGQLPEAGVFAERAVAIRVRELGPDDPLVAESLNTNGTVLGMAGDYAGAVVLFERAVAVHMTRPPAERASEEYGTLCINLAGTYQRLGKYALADTTFANGLDALRVKPGIDHPSYAVSLLAYAALKVDLGRYVEAERLYDEGGGRLEATLGQEHPLYAAYLNNRGFLYRSIGNVTAAEADYRRSLELKRTHGATGVSIASTLRNLAHLIYPRDPREAERLLTEAVDIYGTLPSAPPFDYSTVLLALARAQRDRGALADARETAERGLTIARQGLGTQHPLYATALRDLALIEADTGDDAGAQRNLTEALAIAESAHGASHPDVASFLDALAGFHARRGEYLEAESLYRRSFDIQDQFLWDALAIGSEGFKASSMASALDPIATLIAFQAKAGTQVPSARALAFEVVTQRKGRVLEQVKNWRQQLRDTAAGDVRRELNEWQALLECRTSLTLAIGYRELKPGIVGTCGLEGTALEGRYERLLSELRTSRTDDRAAQAVQAIGVLKAREDAIETNLNRQTGASVDRPRPVHLDDVRRRLAADQLLVEFISYEDAGHAGSRHYGAFVLDSAGTLDWRDLGVAAPVDRAVRDLLSAANDWSVSVRNHEAGAARASEQTGTDALHELSARVWTPLKPLIDAHPNARELVISPDAALNLVPFEALSDGHDLIERFAIDYLPAGRDLVGDAASRHASTAPIVLVSPGADRERRTARTPAASFRAGDLSRLTAASGEAADFRRIVAGSTLYSVADATERRVKDVHGPLLLHIVGHGIIRDGDDCRGGSCAATALDASSPAMTLSAIVLEEAYGRGGTSSEDGMLTPLELQNVDLRGTEMLVLSQCQMANGAASIGEGVYGMRRAAAIAGARTFVAPLWNVDDAVQRTLMHDFYEGLAAGHTRADALRLAKLELRRTPAHRSFLYWAPVIMSGAAGPLPPALFHPPSVSSSARN
jgi:CHAT domain-containing protein/tetratricopeptide (TPR) repeat protein